MTTHCTKQWGKSEKKGFTFPRTKHSLAPLVLSSLPSFSSRSRALFSIRSSFFTFFPTPFSMLLFFLLEQYSFLSSFLTCSLFSFLSLSFSFSSISLLILLHLAPSRYVRFLVSWSILLPHSLALSFSHLSSLSLYSSCRLIKPVDLPSHLSPFVIEIYEPACSRSPFQSILRSSWSFALEIKDLVLRRSGFKLYLRRAKFESEICDLYEASIPFSEFRYN